MSTPTSSATAATTLPTPRRRLSLPTFSGDAYVDPSRVQPKESPDALVASGQADTVQTDGDGNNVLFRDGKPHDLNGAVLDGKVPLKSRIHDWALPNKDSVTNDYWNYRGWEFVNRVSQDSLGYLATMGAAAGLVTAAGVSWLAFLGAGTGALVLKGGLNFIGQIAANNKGAKVDEDPALAATKSGIYSAASSAASAATMAFPSPASFFALVSGGGIFGAFGTQTDLLSKTVIQNHQAKNGLASLVGKNSKQDLISGLIGTGIGLGVGIGLLAALGPVGPLLAVPAFLGISVLANVLKGKALTFDNLSNSIVRGLGHQMMTKGEVPTPDELKKVPRKEFKGQPLVHMGADATKMQQDQDRFQKLKDIAGDNNFLLDVGDTTSGHVHKKTQTVVDVVLKNGASMDDMVHAELAGQALGDIIQSEGYKKLTASMGGDEKAASLKAIELAYAATQNFQDIMDSFKAKGWALDRTVITADGNKLTWKPNPNATPVPPVSLEQVHNFLATGELPQQEAAKS